VVTPSGGDLRDRMLRVGHIGNLSEEDYDALFEALDEVLGKKRRYRKDVRRWRTTADSSTGPF
jgi:aspartate aminotransferase-like enzyme